MGFFGFLDFTKEGPGISKDAPKKKAFFAFFETFFRNFFKFFSLNLALVIMSLPILTHGFAFAGLTNVTRNIARDKHSFGLSDFFSTIRKNWKQALAVGIINSVVLYVLFFAIRFYDNEYAASGSMLSFAGFVLSITFLLVFFMMNFYIYTLMITFSFKLKMLYKNSLKFVFVNLWRNLLCGICLLATYGVYVGVLILAGGDLRVFLLEIIIAVATLPAFRFLMIQYFTFGSIKKYIIDPYYAEHPDADIEKRRDLGLEVPEEDDDEEEPLHWE